MKYLMELKSILAELETPVLGEKLRMTNKCAVYSIFIQKLIFTETSSQTMI